jgi:signal transduction histidine kinase
LLLEKLVISRIAKLIKDVVTIGKCGNNSLRVGISGKDELANLGGAINDMLKALEHIEEQIRTRNKDIRLIMDTIPTGLLSIDEHFNINPEYSISVEQILGKDQLSGKSLLDVLKIDSTGRNYLKEFLDVFCKQLIPEKDMAGLNPFNTLDYKRGEELRCISISYHMIDRGKIVPKNFLVIIADITEEKKLAEKIQQSEQENIQLKAPI